MNILQGLCDIPDQTSKISQKQYKRNDIIIFRKQNQIQNFELLSKITHRRWHYSKGHSSAVTRTQNLFSGIFIRLFHGAI